MTQLKYDIAEFILNNKEELKEFLKSETYHLEDSRELFNSYPELFNEGLTKFKKSLLSHYLSNHFPCCFESICLIVDEPFVKITLDL